MGEPTHAEETDRMQSSLGVKTEKRPGISNVLGVQWDFTQDELSQLEPCSGKSEFRLHV